MHFKAVKVRYYVAIIWACFLVRCEFYGMAFPLWEGFDEWAHFGVAENMRVTTRPLVDPNIHVSSDVEASLELVPLPRGMTAPLHGGMTYATYWQLSTGERMDHQQHLRELPSEWANDIRNADLPAYEASQPPLYYWIVAIPLHVFRYKSLLTRVWVARSTSILIGSLVIPLGYLFALQFFNEWLAVALITFIALMPELCINLSRVANDSLAIVLFTALIVATLRSVSTPDSYVRSVWVGVLLSAGLLTKAYFLTAIPAIVTIRLLLWRKKGTARQFMRHCALLFLMVTVLAGWWYARNVIQTGTVSGLDEAKMLKDATLLDMANGALHIDWLRAIATVMVSHVWYSGWSLLSLPRIIYYLSFAIIALGCAGLVKGRMELHTRVGVLLCFYAGFWVGQIYQIVCLFLSKGSSTAMGGWYLCALVTVEAALLMIGATHLGPSRWQRCLLIVFILGTAAIDFYGLHFVALPYFGHSSFAHPGRLFQQLLINKPSGITLTSLEGMWAIFILATLLLVAIGVSVAVDNDVFE